MTASQALLFDVGHELKRRARAAVEARRQFMRGTAEWNLESGRVLAYYEVISLIQQTARGLGVDLAAIQLADIDPDRELL